MNTRSLLLSILFQATAAVPAVAGSIVIEATPFADATSASVALEVTITENGELLPDCANFGIRRRAIYPCSSWEDVLCIARENGTRTLHFVDNDVEGNTSYQYEVIGYAVSPEPCTMPFADQFAFQAAFFYSGFPVPILEFVTVGPEPTPVAHGQLVSWNDAAANFGIGTCANSCLPPLGGGWGDASVTAYCDTGIEVEVYGTIDYCGNGCWYVLYATSVAPAPCPPIAVEPKTWTSVKRLFH